MLRRLTRNSSAQKPTSTAKLAAFAFFAVLAVIGNKLICGWACPFGALQELIYHLPILRKLGKRKIPFVASNTLRGTLFIVMLLLFGIGAAFVFGNRCVQIGIPW